MRSLPIFLFLLQPNEIVYSPVEFVWPPEQEQVLVLEGRNKILSPALGAICRQMQSNHLEDLDALERTYQQLASSTDADQISEFLGQIKEISSRIRFLARPEWNSESIPVEITWDIPNSFFFDNSEYLALKQAVRNAPVGRAPELAKYLITMPGYVSEKSLVKAEYLNSENQQIIKFLSLKPDDYRDEYSKDRSFLIRLKKNVTTLEACQFLTTMIFEVKINYSHTWLGIPLESEKSIFLLYRNEVASAK